MITADVFCTRPLGEFLICHSAGMRLHLSGLDE